MMNITDQLKESIEYQEAPEDLKQAYAVYLDEWFEINKYVDVENNPLTFRNWGNEVNGEMAARIIDALNDANIGFQIDNDGEMYFFTKEDEEKGGAIIATIESNFFSRR